MYGWYRGNYSGAWNPALSCSKSSWDEVQSSSWVWKKSAIPVLPSSVMKPRSIACRAAPPSSYVNSHSAASGLLWNVTGSMRIS